MNVLPDPPPRDRFDRPLSNLRLSVTDRCNLRCAYCMPEEDYTWLPRKDILTFEELARLAEVFLSLGVSRIRLTGGEPLLRRELPELVRLLAALPGLQDLALTTNGLRLADLAEPLRRAGLDRLTVSLDTLRPDRYEELTRRRDLPRVLDGLQAACDAGFTGTKINTVVLRGFNDDELGALVDFARARDLEIRFIEYMDVGGATRWKPDAVVEREEILARLARRYGPPRPLPRTSNPTAPAEAYRLDTPEGPQRIGIIASQSAPFCAACDRSRLTADGWWYTCLYAPQGTDLRTPLRAGESPQALARRIRGRWATRVDRGAEERASHARRASPPLPLLRQDPHLEMHTRGG